MIASFSIKYSVQMKEREKDLRQSNQLSPTRPLTRNSSDLLPMKQKNKTTHHQLQLPPPKRISTLLTKTSLHPKRHPRYRVLFALDKTIQNNPTSQVLNFFQQSLDRSLKKPTTTRSKTTALRSFLFLSFQFPFPYPFSLSLSSLSLSSLSLSSLSFSFLSLCCKNKGLPQLPVCQSPSPSPTPTLPPNNLPILLFHLTFRKLKFGFTDLCVPNHKRSYKERMFYRRKWR